MYDENEYRMPKETKTIYKYLVTGFVPSIIDSDENTFLMKLQDPKMKYRSFTVLLYPDKGPDDKTMVMGNGLSDIISLRDPKKFNALNK